MAMSAKKLIILFIIALAVSLTGYGYLDLKTTRNIQDTPNTSQINNNIGQKNIDEQAGRLYKIKVEQSQIIWSGEKIIGSGHIGNVKILNGQILLDNGNNLKSANFSIDMNSITESRNNQQVVTHLKSADFFDTAAYPLSELKITAMERSKNDFFNVSGDLTIKGITQKIIFPAQINIKDDEIQAKAEFNIDRTNWNIEYGSGKFFKELADQAIKDEINFKVDLSTSIQE